MADQKVTTDSSTSDEGGAPDAASQQNEKNAEESRPDTGEADDTAQAKTGECKQLSGTSLRRSQSSQSSGIEDSGTESGEDLRFLHPDLLSEVREALFKLENALPSLDINKRVSILSLISKLQSYLKISNDNSGTTSAAATAAAVNDGKIVSGAITDVAPSPPPRRYGARNKPSSTCACAATSKPARHTVGVSKEELEDARKWLAENILASILKMPNDSSLKSGGRGDVIDATETRSKDADGNGAGDAASTVGAVDRLPMIEGAYTKPIAENPLVGNVVYGKPNSFLVGNNHGSGQENFKRVSNGIDSGNGDKPSTADKLCSKQSRIETSDDVDGDVSSTDDDHCSAKAHGSSNETSSSSSYGKKVPSRFSGKFNKKAKMKRANTIDIPRLLNSDVTPSLSGDESPSSYGHSKSADEETTSGQHWPSTEEERQVYRRPRYYQQQQQQQQQKQQQRQQQQQHKQPAIESLPFQIKTDSDKKFMRFVQQTRQDELGSKLPAYNRSSAGDGDQWRNRFCHIKTAFESPSGPSAAAADSNHNAKADVGRAKQPSFNGNALTSFKTNPLYRPIASDRRAAHSDDGACATPKQSPFNCKSRPASFASGAIVRPLNGDNDRRPAVPGSNEANDLKQHFNSSVSTAYRPFGPGQLLQAPYRTVNSESEHRRPPYPVLAVNSIPIPIPIPVGGSQSKDEFGNSGSRSADSDQKVAATRAPSLGSAQPEPSDGFGCRFNPVPVPITTATVAPLQTVTLRRARGTDCSLLNDAKLGNTDEGARHVADRGYRHSFAGYRNCHEAPNCNDNADSLHLPIAGNSFLSQPASPTFAAAYPFHVAQRADGAVAAGNYFSLPTSPISSQAGSPLSSPHYFGPEENWSSGHLEEQRQPAALSRVMGQPQKAVTVTGPRTGYRLPEFGSEAGSASRGSNNIYRKLADRNPALQNLTAVVPRSGNSYGSANSAISVKKKIAEINKGKEAATTMATNIDRSGVDRRSQNFRAPTGGKIAAPTVKPPLIVQRSRSPPLIVQQSRSPPQSPIQMPSVLQKSESWHQMIMERTKQAKPPSPMPKHQIPRLKSSRSFAAFPKQFEAFLSPDSIEVKEQTVRDYLCGNKSRSKSKSPDVSRSSSACSLASKAFGRSEKVKMVELSDDLGNVDQAFEDLFKEASNGKTKT